MELTNNNIKALRNEFSIFEFKNDVGTVKQIIELIIQNEFKSKLSAEHRILLFNLLFLKSAIVFDVYCLIRKSKEEPISILIPGIKEYFEPLLCYGSKILKTRDSNFSFFKNESNVKITAKHIVNRLYYSFSKITANRRKRFKTLIKTWCDVDINLHRHKVASEQSFIVIYPFVANIKRGLNHIKYVQQHFPKRFSLMGIRYSHSKWINILFSKGIKRDLNLLHYEYQGAINHIKDLRGFKVIYTSEEFMANNYLINKRLKNDKIRIINIAHGLGLYSPYSCFDQFKTLNNYQLEFYSRFSEIEEIKALYDDPKTITQLSLSLTEYDLIFIHQNYEDHSDKIRESVYQNDLIEILNKYSTKHKCYIKFHPNTKYSVKKLTLKKFYNLKEYTNTKKKKIFLGTLSTSYYSFRNEGIYVLVGEDKTLLKNIFGGKNIIYNKSELKAALCIV